MLLDGKKISAEILAEIKKEIAGLSEKPGLAVILAGVDPASILYANMKRKACEEVGIRSVRYDFPENVLGEEILKLIGKLNVDSTISGILVQLPLPGHLDKNKIIEAIDFRKDVDGIHPFNIGRTVSGVPIFLPCAAAGIMKFFDYYSVLLEGREAVVVGNSIIVGDPVAEMLSQKNATVTVCNEKTKNLKKYTQNADILVVAAGVRNLIVADMVKKGAVVIDAGINRDNGKVFGDVDFEAVKEICSHITPVPGGVGPMTIAALMENTLKAFKKSMIDRY